MKKMKKPLGELQAILIPKKKGYGYADAINKARAITKDKSLTIVEETTNFYRCRKSGRPTGDGEWHTKEGFGGIRKVYWRPIEDGSKND